MKDSTTTAAPNISDGDLELQMLKFSYAGLAPGFTGNPHLHEDFSFFTNGSDRCQLRKPLKYLKNYTNSYDRRTHGNQLIKKS
jgi:hypothetical protein